MTRTPPSPPGRTLRPAGPAARPANTVLLDLNAGDSLAGEVAGVIAAAPLGARVEIWSFDPPAARARAAAALRAAGFEPVLRAALKPLLHWAMGESPGSGSPLAGARSAVIRCPAVDGAPPRRFALECHPLLQMAPCPVRLDTAPPGPRDAPAWYDVEISAGEISAGEIGAGASSRRAARVFAPNRWREGPGGAPVLSACGWLRITPPGAARPCVDRPLDSGLDACFHAMIDALRRRDWRGPGPHFDRLTLRIEAPLQDAPLPVGHECLSLAEALHEDLYFSALDLLRAAAGLSRGDRGLCPGQIVPEVIAVDGPLRATATMTPAAPPTAPRAPRPPPAPMDPAAMDPASADRALRPGQIAGALARLGGAPLRAVSLQGREVAARLLAARDGAPRGRRRAALISAGQHANEPTGPPGALAAGAVLAREGRAVAVSPMENPDGYALYLDYCRAAPLHMHHAARYTASGADLEWAPPGGEADIRRHVRAAADPWLHVNLHGCPAHEWIRPFTGYVPEGFADWMLPRGFFLILRHHPGWGGVGARLLDAVIAALAGDADLTAFNRAQLARYRAYIPDPAFEIRRDFAVVAAEDARAMFPVTLITEAPDETLRGPAFARLRRAQTNAALAAVRFAQDHAADSPDFPQDNQDAP